MFSELQNVTHGRREEGIYRHRASAGSIARQAGVSRDWTKLFQLVNNVLLRRSIPGLFVFGVDFQ
jgi:hypothetical protein